MIPTTPPQSAPLPEPVPFSEAAAPVAPSAPSPPSATQPVTQPSTGLFGLPTQPTASAPAPATSPAGLTGHLPPALTSPATTHTAASTPPKGPDPYSVAFWCSILLGVVLLGSWGIMVLRRQLRDPDGEAQGDMGFSLSELRAMRDRGEITPEEYERTRLHVINKVKSAMDRPRKKISPPPGGDSLAD